MEVSYRKVPVPEHPTTQCYWSGTEQTVSIVQSLTVLTALPGPREPFKRDPAAPDKRQLKKQAGFIVSSSLTLSSVAPWVGGVIWFLYLRTPVASTTHLTFLKNLTFFFQYFYSKIVEDKNSKFKPNLRVSGASGLPFWIVKNSWGTSWGGADGYFRMERGEGKSSCGMMNNLMSTSILWVYIDPEANYD